MQYIDVSLKQLKVTFLQLLLYVILLDIFNLTNDLILNFYMTV